jgi:hypothetical protein
MALSLRRTEQNPRIAIGKTPITQRCDAVRYCVGSWGGNVASTAKRIEKYDKINHSQLCFSHREANRITFVSFSWRLCMALIKPRESIEAPTSPEVAGESHKSPKDIGTPRSPQAESEVVAESIGSLLKRVAGSSMQEIDLLIAELQTLRKLLQTEGARVQREIADYATLSQSAMQTTSVIAANIAKLKSAAGVTALGRYDDLQGQDRCRATTGLRPDGGVVPLVPQDGGTAGRSFLPSGNPV